MSYRNFVKSTISLCVLRRIRDLTLIVFRYFYHLALKLKMKYVKAGKPVNLDINRLYAEASTDVPYKQWGQYLDDEFGKLGKIKKKKV